MEDKNIISYVIESGYCYDSYINLARKMDCISAVRGNRMQKLQEIEDEKITVKVLKKAYHERGKILIYLIQDTKYDEYFLMEAAGLRLYSNQKSSIPFVDERR